MWQKVQLIVVIALIGYLVYQHRNLQRSILALEVRQHAISQKLILAIDQKPTVCTPTACVPLVATPNSKADPPVDIVSKPVTSHDCQEFSSEDDSEDEVLPVNTAVEPIQTFSSPSSEDKLIIKAIVKDAFTLETLSNMNQKALHELAKSKGVSTREGKRPRTKAEIAKDLLGVENLK